MPDLTLDQVRKAGRFAYDDDGSIFAEGQVWAAHVEWSTGYMPEVNYCSSPLIDREAEVLGWHHLPGCDCEFCQPDENHT